ncbi:Glycosyl transferase, family 2 [Yersinia aldovae ATCC 35236]|uniref:Putative glucosyl-3-phosphoglycerate synthase n=1 Tax=Yersinia aldovae TaxID=29483 RepID=A0A0T9UXC4_YERAL|nr:glycosyltransferase [Yersinia aldovae]EEP93574.1 Glycosyl transferase, family 2 [Yersinia aldovae ATCC 35236]CNL80492.1 putative glucosyl-3-phosphoglycerate synthase [Yersinia aldovae]
MYYRGQHVALIVPCYNEEAAIETVIRGFRDAMPEIDVFVFDNNSTDRTIQVANNVGARVISVPLSGKGNVVRRMFADVDADIYVMVDGDATYDASAVRSLVDKLLDHHLDMVVGCRETKEEIAGEAYRRGHQWGNYILTQSVVKIFGGNFTDMLSGYRAFTRRYAKSFPALSNGFEIETELTVHALELRMPYGEVMTAYGTRPEGSVSKLSTYRDGWRILKTIGRLYISERPFAFFGICGFILALISILLGFPLLTEYLRDGLVPRLPTAVLAASIMMSAALSFVCGLILDNVTRGRHEMKRLVYLGIPLPRVDAER